MVKLRPADTEERWRAGFTSENDIFQRRDLADRLTNLYSDLEDSSVAILEGDWGVGKTTFVKMWRSMLAKRGLPSVYVDAFAQDYVANAYEALCGAFVRAAEDANQGASGELKRFTSRAAKFGKRLLPTAAKIVVKAATIGVVGNSDIEAIQTAIEESADAAADATEERLKEVLEDHSRTEETHLALKKAIEQLVAKIGSRMEGHDSPRLIVFVDELDRCRPAFAVSLLETIKHFFRAEGVHFVIVANHPTLAKSFKAVHNLGDEANEYLEKFYDLGIHLPLHQAEYSERHMRSYVAQVFREVLGEATKRQFGHDLQEMCDALAVAHRLSLRQVNSFVLLASICVTAVGNSKQTNAMLVAHLILLKIKFPELYLKVKAGTIRLEEMQSIVAPSGDSYNSEHVQAVFAALLEKDLNAIPEDYRGISFGMSRSKFLPHIANSVIDLFAQPTMQTDPNAAP